MAKQKVLNNAPMSKEEKNKNLELMVKHGEPLAQDIINKLSSYGCSPKALMAETYAVAKAYGALRAMSLSEGYDCQSLFDKLVPMFQEETEEMLAEMGQENSEDL